MATPQPLTYNNFVPEVRAYIRDFPELNRLISGEETSNRMIEYCARLAIDEYNTTPPLTSLAIGAFPSRAFYYSSLSFTSLRLSESSIVEIDFRTMTEDSLSKQSSKKVSTSSGLIFFVPKHFPVYSVLR